MQLKRLEAIGFKSFADKIEIEFGRGITAVVGPNGSGKSNITDAIRWALGEQNVRNLRASTAKEIIFTGSAVRRPLNVAEVSLTFINDGDIAIDFDEVVITRRIYRDGESEFFINKSRTRLKEIYKLFADTGIGHDGLSVISQNKMDDVLNSRPEERRLFFEETAGITKYRDRKRESVRKLDDTEKNLVRYYDLLSEVKNQLEPLSAEAEKTRQHNIWQGELRQAKVTELCRAENRLRREEDEIKEKQEAQRAEVVATETTMRTLQAEREVAEKDALDIENAIRKQTGQREELRQKIERVKSDIRVLEERRRQGDENQSRLEHEAKELEKRKKAAADSLSELIKAEDAMKKLKDEAEKNLVILREKAKQKTDEVYAQREESRRAESLRNDAERAKIAKEHELEMIDQQIKSGRTAHDARSKSAAEAERALAANRDELKDLKDQVEALEKRQKSAEETLAETARRRKELAIILRTKNEALRIAQQYIAQAESKIGMLKDLQQSYEGFGKAQKNVLLSKESWRKGVAGAVAELINVPQKYLTAASVALGASQQNIVTYTDQTAKQAISFLKRKGAGRATFLPLSSLEVRKPSAPAPKNLPGVIGYMNEFVESAKKYQKAVDFLLARTLLVDNMDHALAVAKEQNYRTRIVTIEGELLSPGGSIAGGSLSARDGGFLSRVGEIDALQKSLEENRETAKKNQEEFSAAMKESADAEKNEDQMRAELGSIREETAQKRGNLERLEAEVKKKSLDLEAMKSLERESAETFQKQEERRVAIARELREASGKLRALTDAATAAREKQADLEDDANLQSRLLNTKEIEAARFDSEIKLSQDHVAAKRKEIEEIEETLRKKRDDFQKLLAGIAEGQGEIKNLSGENEKLQIQSAEIEEVYKKLISQKAEKEAESREKEKASSSARQKLEKIQDKIHALEMAAVKINADREQRVNTLMEDYSLTVEAASEIALQISDSELSSKIRELTRQIEELGPVNLAAINEYEKLRERHDFMQGQAEDLEVAKANLLKIIQDMDQTMTRQFREKFELIKIAFQDIFSKLFGGGQADLYLTDEKKILESGVDISVQIPEKRRQNLAALSGGERALTVIALLFSFLTVRPAPFSVLDEIDAPLDEVNIMRFGKFLREFSAKTQFVIVTHRKGTMESADAMYGVTLEEAGVSKIISVKLDELPA